jgi:hypothetical protein
MTDVHNHDIDPGCPERQMSDGSLRGECMTDFNPPAEAVEAAARAMKPWLWEGVYRPFRAHGDTSTYEGLVERDQDEARSEARKALTAAGPIIAAQALREAAETLRAEDRTHDRWYAYWLRDRAARIESATGGA